MLILALCISSLVACTSADEDTTSEKNDTLNTDSDLSASVYDPSEDDSEDTAEEDTTEEEGSTLLADSDAESIDLTTLSSTMVYAEVYNMMVNPEDYIGKTVTMEGEFTILEDVSTGNIYTACLIYDAAACCAQGLEFLLVGDAVYPDDYPEVGDAIKVTGVFETYDENGIQYCHLVDSVLEYTIE